VGGILTGGFCQQGGLIELAWSPDLAICATIDDLPQALIIGCVWLDTHVVINRPAKHH
jgi:hypothetical protein